MPTVICLIDQWMQLLPLEMAMALKQQLHIEASYEENLIQSIPSACVPIKMYY